MGNILPGSLIQLSSSQPSGDDTSSFWGGLVMLIISTCIYFFYAKAQFGVFLGILYSLFWYCTVPVHFIISCL